MPDFKAEMHNIRFSLRLRPDPDGEAYSAPPDPLTSGVAGPLAARGGGQICRPFVLGFGNWRACLKYNVNSRPNISILVSS